VYANLNFDDAVMLTTRLTLMVALQPTSFVEVPSQSHTRKTTLASTAAKSKKKPLELEPELMYLQGKSMRFGSGMRGASM
jgi:hypothetical protein